MENVFEAYEEMQARILLESVPKDFWEPSDEAKHQVRQELLDKIAQKPKDLNSFHRQLSHSIRDGALRMARQVDDWKKEGRFKWNPGDVVHSTKTGKTYTITGYGLTGKLKNPDPAYHYQRGVEGSGDFEKGQFVADKAHAEDSSLKLLTPKK
jgi:hypothetical protein